MASNTLLILTIALPFLGAITLWPLSKAGDAVVRWATLAFSLATLAGVAALIAQFQAGDDSQLQFLFAQPWLAESSGLDVQLSFALDGLSIWLFGLTALLMITSVLASWTAITDRPALFYAMLLLLEGGCLGVFAAQDVALFYIFFEFTLIPLFFLIGIWGSEQRRYAAVKFFLYTLAGSVLTFLGLVTLVVWHYLHQPAEAQLMTFSIPALTEAYASGKVAMPASIQIWVFLALFAGFAIKAPLFPLHTWLPLAHVQAPTAGSVFLAGLLLKIGVYGLIRFNAAMLPEATAIIMPWLLWLCVAGILYGALVALAQSDMKRLIAYSSVSHLGFVLLGLFAFNPLGVQGGALQMVNHGISTGALFALVGMIYERWHTREIASFGGLARVAPCLAFFFLFFTFSSIGLPGLNGFAGEFPILAGMFQRAFAGAPEALASQYRWIAVLSVLGVVLGAWYMLYLVRQVFFGPTKTPDTHGHAVHDLNLREILALAPLAVFAVWIGLQPDWFFQRSDATLTQAVAAVAERLPNPPSPDSPEGSQTPAVSAQAPLRNVRSR